MARINQELLDAIIGKLGSKPTTYRRIQEVQRETFLERHLAALVVASRLKIGINRYSTAEDRQTIRGFLAGGPIYTPSVSPTGDPPPPTRGKSKATKPRTRDNSVFVIGGRDTILTNSMYELLSALGCKPVEFHQAVAKVRGTGNPFIGQVLDKAFERVQALVVLFSPDDEAKLKDYFITAGEKATEGRLRGQARPNVIFEAGMALGRHEEKTIMVQVGAMKSFSDIAGRHMIHLDDSYERRLDFATRLGRLCKIDTSGVRWTEVGTFEPSTSAPKRKSRKKRR
jgi:predicted nucleotide-binding protein